MTLKIASPVFLSGNAGLVYFINLCKPLQILLADSAKMCTIEVRKSEEEENSGHRISGISSVNIINFKGGQARHKLRVHHGKNYYFR
jgi:hypothetical protein